MEAASEGDLRILNMFRSRLLCGFNSDSAKCCVLFADLERCLVIRAIVPSFQLIEAIPLLNNKALWCRPRNSSQRFCTSATGSSDGDEPTACRFYDGLC